VGRPIPPVSPSSPATAAFPILMQGRRPHWTFRGLLNVHSRYGLSARCIAKATHLSRRLRRFRYLHRRPDSYRLERPRGKQSWRTPRFVVLAMGCSPIRYTMCTSSSLISTRLISVLIISRRAAQSAESNPCVTSSAYCLKPLRIASCPSAWEAFRPGRTPPPPVQTVFAVLGDVAAQTLPSPSLRPGRDPASGRCRVSA